MNNLIQSLKTLIIEAGEIALDIKHSGLNVEYKYDHSPVTNADKAVSKVIYDRLIDLTPNIQVICEEQPLVPLKNDTFWLIDPIDGTRSFIRNENSYTINIGLIENGVPTFGFIYQPETKKLHYTDANKNLKIEKNGKSLDFVIQASKDSYVAVIGSHYFNKSVKNFLKNNLISEVLTVPSSIKLCLISEGAGDIYPRFGQTMEWDTAAGHALVLAAGGNILDTHGKQLTYGKDKFSNPNFFALSKNWMENHRNNLIPH